MNYQFEYRVTAEATEVRLNGSSGSLLTDSWAIEAPKSLLTGVDLTQRLIAAGAAIGAAGVPRWLLPTLLLSAALLFPLPR